MLLLWASYLVVKNVQFTHIVPHKHVLTLTARKIKGKKQLAIEDVQGQYADWLFAARKIALDTLNHVAQLENMTMDCKSSAVRINAKSGILNLQSYNATVLNAHLTHRNIIFRCPQAIYDHQSQKITCKNGMIFCDISKC